MTVKELERIALDSQKGHELIIGKSKSASIYTYESEMGIPIRKAIKLLKRHFGKPIIVADIGGNIGYAAYGINRMWGVQAFCIDKCLEINPKLLPRERYIVADALMMSNIPSDSFHFIMGYNSVRSASSFTEIYRVLKPGGYAYLDLEPTLEEIRDKISIDIARIRVHKSMLNIHLPLNELLELIDLAQKSTKLGEEPNRLLQDPAVKDDARLLIEQLTRFQTYAKIDYVYELHKPIQQSPSPL